MQMKPSLTFYTNIISPYQLDFFSELAKLFTLRVVFYAQSENDRSWTLSVNETNYEVIFLKTSKLAKFIQKFMTSYHFSASIFRVSYFDTSDNIILGGNYFIPNTLVALFLSSLRRKKIYWFGERLYSAGPIKTFVKKIMLQPILRLTDGVFAVGADAIASYKGYGYQRDCFNIPYNIDNKKFDKKFLEDKKLKALQQTLNAENRLIVLTSGSLISRKGMDVAIRAFRAVAAENKSRSELWVLGDGELRSELESLAEDENNIKFLGFLQPSEIPYIFGLSDIFLFCSKYDGWAVVINEAISAGLPVITSMQARASELVLAGDLGYVHDCGEIYKFTESLELLISDSKLRGELSARAKLFAKTCNSSSMADKVLQVITPND